MVARAKGDVVLTAKQPLLEDGWAKRTAANGVQNRRRWSRHLAQRFVKQCTCVGVYRCCHRRENNMSVLYIMIHTVIKYDGPEGLFMAHGCSRWNPNPEKVATSSVLKLGGNTIVASAINANKRPSAWDR